MDIRLKSLTDAEWTTSGVILAVGKMGYAHDTKVLKIGDGINTWDDLDGVGGGGGLTLLADEIDIPWIGSEADGDPTNAPTRKFNIGVATPAHLPCNGYEVLIDLDFTGMGPISIVQSSAETFYIAVNEPDIYVFGDNDWSWNTDFSFVALSNSGSRIQDASAIISGVHGYGIEYPYPIQHCVIELDIKIIPSATGGYLLASSGSFTFFNSINEKILVGTCAVTWRDSTTTASPTLDNIGIQWAQALDDQPNDPIYGFVKDPLCHNRIQVLAY